MGVGTDKAVGGDAQRVGGRAAQNGVLHDDALAANLDGAALRDDLSAEHDSGARPDGDVSTNDRVWSDERCGVNDGRFAQVFDEHGAMVEQRRCGAGASYDLGGSVDTNCSHRSSQKRS